MDYYYKFIVSKIKLLVFKNWNVTKNNNCKIYSEKLVNSFVSVCSLKYRSVFFNRILYYYEISKALNFLLFYSSIVRFWESYSSIFIFIYIIINDQKYYYNISRNLKSIISSYFRRFSLSVKFYSYLYSAIIH